jgi:asparagine synthase (glutamine-hydrolysing)
MVSFGADAPREEVLRAMTRSIAHRGPDDSGTFVKGPVGLGHVRLSIIDLSAAGHQPMHGDDGNVTLVYNGEVYNFPMLKRELEGLGIAFTGRSDTEVVLRGYLEWGTAVFERLHGMFALALWDGRTRELHLARDRFGIKPLYYHRGAGGLVFGSEIKALLASGRVRPAPGWAGLHEYMWYGAPAGENTAYEGVLQLLPGRLLTASDEGVRTRSFWSLDALAQRDETVEEATRTVRDLLERAVKSHLVSDVPVGVFLSGGIDSTAVTALASRHYGGRLRTYSVGFDFSGDASELPVARGVAERFGTEHHELFVRGGDLRGVIERLVQAHDQPFGDAANIPLYLLCAELAGSVKVVLQGDGGDEVFAGYRRYNVLSAEPLWRAVAAVGNAAGVAAGTKPRALRVDRFLRAVGETDPALRMALLLTTETRRNPPTRIFSPEWRAALEEHDPFRAYREVQARFARLDPVQRMLYADMEILLPSTYLEKVDRSTMAHAIEVRVPFLDAELAEYAMALPSRLKVRRGQKKWLLRRALRGIVPDEVLDRPKTGFGVPFERWLRGPLAEYMRGVLTDPSTVRAGIFDAAHLERAMREHVGGERNHGFLLWKALNLALWQQRYLSPTPGA